ncbi:MAG TPA: sigma-70 family RNA polymerase sigma factor [Gemmatimonadaceae bacterium]|nr:sigma-70 family RNA polymerase sigma factor [Gemmatimonadaceae bacterium]
MDEPELVKRVQSGDTAAFDELVRRHSRRAFAVAWRIMGRREDAEDLVQEAFMAALNRIDSFEPGRPFAPWLLRIVMNRGLNARRARVLRATDEIPHDVSTGDDTPHEDLERRELTERLRAAMADLPERQRMVLQLFELDGLSAAEVAEVLGISAGTVRWHAHEGRAALRRVLAGAYGNPEDEAR